MLLLFFLVVTIRCDNKMKFAEYVLLK